MNSQVRMVTGDNLQTAKAIALECGILMSTEDAVEPNIIEGKTFRELSEKEREQVAKKITVWFFHCDFLWYSFPKIFENIINPLLSLHAVHAYYPYYNKSPTCLIYAFELICKYLYIYICIGYGEVFSY